MIIMAIITPTITAENPHIYREQAQRIESFAQRVHIDLMDGVFAPSTSVRVDQVWLPENMISDIHVMFQNPGEALAQLISLKPNLIILPAEADFDAADAVDQVKSAGIKFGLALLPETPVSSLNHVIHDLDHVLIFSGNLGYQGGSVANLDLLEKAAQTKALNPELEIGWDGGVNDGNVRRLADAGIDVINVGGYIQKTPDAGLAYKSLVKLLP